MISHKIIRIKEERHSSSGVLNDYKIFCGGEPIGSITEYNMTGMIVTCYFHPNKTKEIETLKEGVKYIEREFEAYISNIIRVNA